MPIVVSDTSPLRALQHLHLLWILERIYERVYLPDAVAEELRRSRRLFPALDLAAHAFLIVENPVDAAHVHSLEAGLDAGEAAAIVLALEKKAEVVLMDEMDGRRVAKSLGLTTIGVVGLLLKAKKEGLVPALKPLIDALKRDIEFHLAPAIVAEVLRLAGE